MKIDTLIALLPIAINLLSAIVIFILARLRKNIGWVWLISTLLSLTNWGIIFASRWFYPINFRIGEWFPMGEIYQQSINFQIDLISWPLLFALCAVQTAVIITDSSRLEEIPSSSIWFGVFSVYTVGLLAVMANSIMAILLVWVVIDVIEFIVLIRTTLTNQQVNEIVVSSAVKVTGLFFLILGILISYKQGIPLQINQQAGLVGYFLLIAVGLRLGVIPFNLPLVSGSPIRRSLGNSIRMISVSTSIILLLRLPIGLLTGPFRSFLLFMTGLGIFFGSIMWLSAKTELEGRPYLIISMAGLAIYSAINENQLAILIWTLALILDGSILFLFSIRSKRLLIFPLLATIGLIGLPYTPSAAGWLGVIQPGNLFRNMIIVLSMILIVLGFVTHATKDKLLLPKKEKWIWLTYPMGLFILIITQWAIFIASDLSWYSTGIILASTFAFLTPLIIFFLNRKFVIVSEYKDFFQSILNPIGKLFTQILSLRWLYRFVWTILGFIQKIVNAFTSLLEGQGGIIWVVVFLIMIITLINSGDIS